MKFFADTASLNEIEYSFSSGVNDGITTNPKIIESTGDLSNGFREACKSIINKYPNVPISLETDLDGMSLFEVHSKPEKVKKSLLKQAYYLRDLGENVVIKIPICEGGLLATEELFKKGIKTNVTACMTPYQALTAASYGATYVSLFANRMLDSKILEFSNFSLEEIEKNVFWKEVLKENKEKYFEEAWSETINEIAYVAKELEGKNTELIVGSIRSSEDIYRIVKAQPQIITIPTKIVENLENIIELKKCDRKDFDFKNSSFKNSITHPMTNYTLKEFEESAKKYKY